jgi:hypothetical protein
VERLNDQSRACVSQHRRAPAKSSGDPDAEGWEAMPGWRPNGIATRDTGRGHGRREIRTCKILTISTGVQFPHATQAVQIRRRRHRQGPAETLHHRTVYAITNLRVYETRPAQLAAWIRRHQHNREQDLGAGRHLRRRPLPDSHRYRTASHGRPTRRRHRRTPHRRNHQHRRRHPASRARQQPPAGAARHQMTTLPRWQ